ncbi:menaquinone reductase multiheme cytochrome c subunit QrcA [Desulfohalovibrio reitneri]|uniref:menaquinone reductase multiheme cytochrome c subunit QrcA n=1 Tax=Desulfohalovibrio reitneri TaxID=1307759 RepID=UPI0004A725AE|nr:menaquinone reductase multiheme cytochrome c subunit QrcA [Desulfohalovibrio reitneri]
MDRSRRSEQGGIAFLLLGLLLGLGFGWFVFPQLLFSEETQPVQFSHRVHMEDVGMACDECHYYREDGSFNGYPSNEECAMCHFAPTGGDREADKAIDHFVTEYYEKGVEVPWVTYQEQPDNVYFSHIAHDGWDCAECHPDIGNADDSPKAYRNRLTGYTKTTMKMWECERCHARSGVSNACYVCHK